MHTPIINVWYDKLTKFVQIILFTFFILGCFIATAYAGGVEHVPDTDRTANTLYFGGTIGYGVNSWGMYVVSPSTDNNDDDDDLAKMVSPVSTQGSGFAGGAILGYYLSRYFAIEGTYVTFPNATVTFENPTIYKIWVDNYKEGTYDRMKTESNAYGFYGKFIIPIKYVKHLHAFASAGIGAITRKDVLTNDVVRKHFSGIFGLGLIYNFACHIMSQIGVQVFTGSAKVEAKPALDYFPFLWQVHFILAYQIKL